MELDSRSAASQTPTERTPSDVEQQVLALTLESSVDEVCAAFDACDWLLGRARGIDQLLKEIGIAYIERNGPVHIGPVRYSVGYATTVKCTDVPRTGHAVLDAAAGDFDRFLGVLVAQPFKHAAVRGLVGRPLHEQLFESRTVGRLVTDAPERVLKRTDLRFVPVAGVDAEEALP